MNQTAAEQVKAAGLHSLKSMADRSGIGSRTLQNWAKDRPALFELLIEGCMGHVYQAEIDRLQRQVMELELLINDKAAAGFLDGIMKVRTASHLAAEGIKAGGEGS